MILEATENFWGLIKLGHNILLNDLLVFLYPSPPSAVLNQ